MPKILVLDDNEELAPSMQGYLQKKGHEVDWAPTVSAAYDCLSSNEYDLLILDWELPDGCGLDVCKTYRKCEGLGGVLMLTGRSSAEDKVAGLNAGADDYLTKPFSIPEFSARVDALLRRAKMSKRPEALVFDESLVGKTFAGVYLIEAILGSGGMGVVYKATNKTLKRECAIKVLSAKNLGTGARQRFEREARAMSLLEHPCLIKIYDFGFAGNNPYIAMEYLEGRTLSSILEDCRCLRLEEALPVFIDICKGLEHAHALSIIHRDLKPANIVITKESGRAKILDLGVAKFVEPEDGIPDLTFAGEVVGSPGYMSPEQGINKTIDQRSDIYSLACVFYEALSGELPVVADSFVEVINAKLKNKPPSLCARFPEHQFPEELDLIIAKALDPLPEKRYSTVSQMRQELEKIKPDAKKGRKKVLSFVRGLFSRKK